MTTWKRLVSFALATALALSITACAKGTGSGSGAAGSGGTPQADAGEAITLNFWHIWADPNTSGDRRIVDAYIEQFTAGHPNVTIVQDATPDTENWKNKMKVAFSGGDIPDVFFTLGGGFSKIFVETGRVLPLDEYISAETRARLMPGTIDNFIYDGQTYGLPIKMWAGVLFCNTELFEAEGLPLPHTWDDLITAVDAFRAAGYHPLCLGAKDGWHIGMYNDIIALRMGGVEQVTAALEGNGSFDTPEMVRTAELLLELVAHDAFNTGFMGIGANEAQSEFLMGRIPMYFNGSWLTGDIQNENNLVKDKIAALPFPAIPGEKSGTTVFSGGAIDGFAASNESPNAAIAAEFVIGLAEYYSVEAYKSGDGITVWECDVSDDEINPLLRDIKTMLDGATGYCLAWDTHLAGTDVNTYLATLQELVGGGITPEEYARNLQGGLSVAGGG